jgi:hypothetical protein
LALRAAETLSAADPRDDVEVGVINCVEEEVLCGGVIMDGRRLVSGVTGRGDTVGGSYSLRDIFRIRFYRINIYFKDTKESVESAGGSLMAGVIWSVGVDVHIEVYPLNCAGVSMKGKSLDRQ